MNKAELLWYRDEMGSTTVSNVLDSFLEPLSRCLDEESGQRVLDFKIDPALRTRLDLLAERANDGVLTEDERAEYAALVDAGDLVSILKLKLRRQLQSKRE